MPIVWIGQWASLLRQSSAANVSDCCKSRAPRRTGWTVFLQWHFYSLVQVRDEPLTDVRCQIDLAGYALNFPENAELPPV